MISASLLFVLLSSSGIHGNPLGRSLLVKARLVDDHSEACTLGEEALKIVSTVGLTQAAQVVLEGCEK